MLNVRIGQATFAKDCNYFIAMQFDEGAAVQKYRTEVSEPASKPCFTKNSFSFDLPDELNAETVSKLERVQFGLFVMLPGERNDPGDDSGTTTKLLGSTSYDISDGMDRLLKGQEAHSTLTFIRRPQPEVEVPVGRIAITVSLKQSDSEDSSPRSRIKAKVARSTRLNPAVVYAKHDRLVHVLVHQAANLPVSAQTGSCVSALSSANTLKHINCIPCQHYNRPATQCISRSKMRRT